MRILAFEEIMGATRGAARFEKKDGTLLFHRFTEDEYLRYTPHNPEVLALRMPSTSCVHLVFSTDSDRLYLKAHLSQASSRFFGDAIDILINGELFRSLGHEGKAELDIDQTLWLPIGEKKITLVFPGLYTVALHALGIADDAIFIPHRAKRRMLIYGDSITQGYDAKEPSKSYASLLALALDADAVNKAIGGEVYYPPLADMDTGVEDPDLITVAYGVNDWHCGVPADKYFENARDFFHTLKRKYPKAKLCVLSPIWCGDSDSGKPFPFRDLPDIFARAVEGLSDAHVIDCYDFIPHDPVFFADGGLHPNDEGYRYYFEGIVASGVLK